MNLLLGAKISLPRLVFDLLSSKQGPRSPVSWASLLLINSPSILDLWTGTGQTDKQTDRQTMVINTLCPLARSAGRGIIMMMSVLDAVCLMSSGESSVYVWCTVVSPQCVSGVQW